MRQMQDYKCPSCGGHMDFDGKTQKMKCPFCGSEMAVSEMEKKTEEEMVHPESTWREGETDGMRIYVCASCGGEIVAEKSTGASRCPYCDNPVVMKGQFSGDLRPDGIIPFKVDKKAAKEAYKNHLTGKIFLPSVFKTENHIDEIQGVYVPFWLFDLSICGEITFEAENRRTWRQGDTEYTETEIFEVTRSGEMGFAGIPEDASSKMDDTLMEAVEPFDAAEAVAFQNAYLSGYMAERYDVTAKERIDRATKRAAESLKARFRESVTGYDAVREEGENVERQEAAFRYVLYPVWILNTSWRNRKYVFAMNGQTGHLVGDLPCDKALMRKYVIIRGTLLGVLLYAAMAVYALI